jgi:alkylation response protein AidB-like acyl-CoA dehydrogenase
MSIIVDRRDLDFYLYEMFDVDALVKTDRYSMHDRESISTILSVAESIAEDVYLPAASYLDVHEPEFVDGEVVTSDVLKNCISVFRDAGFFSLGFDAEQAGMQLPHIVSMFCTGIFCAANAPAHGYAFLTAAAAKMLNACGSEQLKSEYLQPLIDGRWFGTMCLSETQAGSSLADIKTKAEPLDDGTYKLTGTKMWISGGDQDISDNIIHMVLAKIPDGGVGVRGISLFLVPKIRVNSDGSFGQSNNIALAGINHKMGQRGTVNTVLNFGESGDCIGYLIGNANEGLKNMFHMMNEARIGVGMGAHYVRFSGVFVFAGIFLGAHAGAASGRKKA